LDTLALIEKASDDGQSSAIVAFLRRVQRVTWNRRLAVMDRKSIAVVTRGIKENGHVCIVWGCSVPVILGQNEDALHELIG